MEHTACQIRHLVSSNQASSPDTHSTRVPGTRTWRLTGTGMESRTMGCCPGSRRTQRTAWMEWSALASGSLPIACPQTSRRGWVSNRPKHWKSGSWSALNIKKEFVSTCKFILLLIPFSVCNKYYNVSIYPWNHWQRILNRLLEFTKKLQNEIKG